MIEKVPAPARGTGATHGVRDASSVQRAMDVASPRLAREETGAVQARKRFAHAQTVSAPRRHVAKCLSEKKSPGPSEKCAEPLTRFSSSTSSCTRAHERLRTIGPEATTR